MKKNDFLNVVVKADPFMTLILANQIWMEHLLIEILKVVLPNSKPLLKDRTPNFLNLIMLCECHNIFDSDFANVLRKLNTQRNKYAHKLSHEPNFDEISEIQKNLRELRNPFLISHVSSSKKEFAIILASVSGKLQNKFNELKVTKATNA